MVLLAGYNKTGGIIQDLYELEDIINTNRFINDHILFHQKNKISMGRQRLKK